MNLSKYVVKYKEKDKFLIISYFAFSVLSLIAAILMIYWIYKINISSSIQQKHVTLNVKTISNYQKIQENILNIIDAANNLLIDTINEVNYEKLNNHVEKINELISLIQHETKDIIELRSYEKIKEDINRAKLSLSKEIILSEHYTIQKEMIKKGLELLKKIKLYTTEKIKELRIKNSVISEELSNLWQHLKNISIIAGIYGVVFCILTFLLAHNYQKRKKLLHKYEESINRYSALVDHIPDLVFIHKNGIIQYVNGSCVASTGYRPEELIGRHVLDFVVPEYKEQVIKSIEQRMKGIKVPDYEIQVITKSGYIKHVIVRGEIITYERDIAMLIILIDITERRQTELKLKESEEKYRLLFDSSPTGLLIQDTKGNILDVNESMCTSLGYTKEELLKMKIHQLTDPSLWKLVDENLRKLQKGEILRHEVVNKRKDGSFCEFEITERKITLSDGKEVIYVLSNDISQRKKAETEIQKYLKELKELNATKDKFFSIISHDLRTPFSVFSSFANILKSSLDEFNKNEIINLINEFEKSIEKTNQLLENLLTWSRLQTNTLKFNPKHYNITDDINECIEIFQPKALKKEITLYSMINTPINVYADREMIKTVLRNLISNAIKFTRNNGCVKIYHEYVNGYLSIIVEDNGTGMKQEIIDQLFKIETHFSTPGTNNETGSGLGLILSNEFIKKNNGKILIESVPGLGSKFKILIPIHDNTDTQNSQNI